MAAPAFRAAGTLATTSSGATGVNVPYPAGIAANDLLVIQLANGSSGTLIIPSGWTRLFGPLPGAGASGQVLQFLYKVAAGGETGTLNVRLDNNQNIAGIMSAYSGADPAAPIDTSATANLPTSGTTGTNPSVTTTKADTLLLHVFWDWSGSGTITPNAADTERYDTFDSLLNYITELATKTQNATGATGTSAVTFSTATSGGLAATVALAPIPAAGPPVTDFTATPLTGTASLSVAFTDTSTNTPTSWAWDFGDGTTSTSQNPTHSYTTSGTYTVSLIASNASGSNTKTRTAYITVSEAIAYATGGGIEIY